MSRFDRPFKKQYELISTRFSPTRGDISVIYDKNNEFYLIGIGLTLDNVQDGGPYGSREAYTREDALNEMRRLID